MTYSSYLPFQKKLFCSKRVFVSILLPYDVTKLKKIFEWWRDFAIILRKTRKYTSNFLWYSNLIFWQLFSSMPNWIKQRCLFSCWLLLLWHLWELLFLILFRLLRNITPKLQRLLLEYYFIFRPPLFLKVAKDTSSTSLKFRWLF